MILFLSNNWLESDPLLINVHIDSNLFCQTLLITYRPECHRAISFPSNVLGRVWYLDGSTHLRTMDFSPSEKYKIRISDGLCSELYRYFTISECVLSFRHDPMLIAPTGISPSTPIIFNCCSIALESDSSLFS